MWSLLSSDVSAHEVTVRISKEVLSLSASPLPLLFLPSPSPLSLPSEGLVCSVSLLYRESLADDSLKTLPTEQRKQARRLTAIVCTHTHARKHTHTPTNTHRHMQWMHRVCISYPVGDGAERWGWTWHLKSRSNYFSKHINVSLSGSSYELCSFDTGDISRGADRQSKQHREEWGGESSDRGKLWFNHVIG